MYLRQGNKNTFIFEILKRKKTENFQIKTSLSTTNKITKGFIAKNPLMD